jgi:cytochrome c biogenesis protein CcmG, thiol:disulfide interchange protein DsbE
VVGLAAAAVATVVLVLIRSARDRPTPTDAGLIGKGQPAPAILATTLDGASLDLASLRGRPVLVNFWGPSCVPCRDEFPLFKAKLAEHAADGLAIVGVLMYDPPAPARDFIAAYGATWPTVDDPSGAIRTAYRVAARPQTYFIDRAGILRAIQVGQVTDAEFERQYALLSGGASSP